MTHSYVPAALSAPPADAANAAVWELPLAERVASLESSAAGGRPAVAAGAPAAQFGRMERMNPLAALVPGDLKVRGRCISSICLGFLPRANIFWGRNCSIQAWAGRGEGGRGQKGGAVSCHVVHLHLFLLNQPTYYLPLRRLAERGPAADQLGAVPHGAAV